MKIIHLKENIHSSEKWIIAQGYSTGSQPSSSTKAIVDIGRQGFPTVYNIRLLYFLQVTKSCCKIVLLIIGANNKRTYSNICTEST